jgi:DNA polymerase-3 subunit alpha
MQPTFTHLRVHTEYSLVDGLIPVKALMKNIADLGMSAVAVTDYCNLFAAVKVFQAAMSMGVKPIIGCDMQFVYPDKPQTVFQITFLCQNAVGYRNLTKLVSLSYQEGHQQVLFPWIEEHAEGLIALSCGPKGDIGQAILQDDTETAHSRARRWQAIFQDRFYLEIQRIQEENEAAHNTKLVQLANALQLPLVATNAVCFIHEEDYEAHEARVCIHEGVVLGAPRSRRYTTKQYLRSPQEMQMLFQDLPSAIQNTVEISKRCTVQLELGKAYLPHFPTPNGTSIEDYLSALANKGLTQRIPEPTSAYTERLETELKVINAMGFAGYFLIVSDFIQWAKDNNIPVGPGRGSGAGSLVAYALNITDLDPLPYDLLFERFLNPERVSMPDFDIDFCMEGRDRVIEYVADKYGRQNVSQIITFGTMAAKAVVRDVGRALGHPYGFVDKIAKLIPFELGITLTDALNSAPELKRRYEDESDVKDLIDLAKKLEGITRNAGKHAGGVVIAPSALTDFTAVYCEQGSTQWVSQFDKDDVEAVGLVKFDFLGLRTLTIIDWALEIIRSNQVNLDINTIPLDDKKTFTLLHSGYTTAVFQLESRGMKELIHRLEPDCFEEVIALVALFRPGPLQSGMVDDFIDRKHGRASVIYPHPELEPILKPTYGVILYQEQVMQIAQVLAGYTLGGADLLRRAMGKKKPEEMMKQRTIFTEGAMARGVTAEVAGGIFDLMEKFAGYGFNKSHSAAYALVSYQTAYLKAHFPAAFMAAVLSADMDNTDKIIILRRECEQMGLKVLVPSINQSQYRFTLLNSKTIIYGLGALKGVGEAAIQIIISARMSEGPFTGLFEFCRRIDLRKVNRRVLEALIASGACDEWNQPRSVLLASLDKSIQSAVKFHTDNAQGQRNLFALFEEIPDEENYVTGLPVSFKACLDAEKAVLGYYLSAHPTTPFESTFISKIIPLEQLDPTRMKKVLVCGLIVSNRQITTKRGKILYIIGIENAHRVVEVVVFSEVFERHQEILRTGEIVFLEGDLSHDEYNGGVKLMAQGWYSITDARTHFTKSLVLSLTSEDSSKLELLKAVLQAHPGSCAVRIDYMNNQAQAKMHLPQAWHVTLSDILLLGLHELLGETQVRLEF